MAVTPQTNIDLDGIASILCNVDDICISGHLNPDGDCIGSMLALRLCLLQLDKNVSVLLSSKDILSDNFMFLPGSEKLICAERFKGKCSTFIAVDCPSPERMGIAAANLHKEARTTITIDHHAAPISMSKYSYTDPDSPSTTMIVWELAKKMGVVRNAEIATCTYAGLITDTGRFQHQNTNACALKAGYEMVCAGANASKIAEHFFSQRSVASVKLEGIIIDRMILLNDGKIAISYITNNDMCSFNASKADCEPLIDSLRVINTVKVCCVLREEAKHIRGSFRAKDDTDVAEIARRFNGGGHKAAAGFTLNVGLNEALALVEKALIDAVSVLPESRQVHGG